MAAAECIVLEAPLARQQVRAVEFTREVVAESALARAWVEPGALARIVVVESALHMQCMDR